MPNLRRLKRCFPKDSSEPPPEALDAGMTAMLVKLTATAETIGAFVSDFRQLEMRFMQSIGGDEGTVLPRDDEEVFKAFLNWAVVSARRARSLNVIVRTAGSVMAETERRNLTKIPEVKAFITARGASQDCGDPADDACAHSSSHAGKTCSNHRGMATTAKRGWRQCSVSAWGKR